MRTKRNERNEKCLCAQLLALRAFSLPAEGGEVKPDLRAEKAAAASGSAYTGEPAVCTSRKSERRCQFAVTHEEEMLSLKSQVLMNKYFSTLTQLPAMQDAFDMWDIWQKLLCFFLTCN